MEALINMTITQIEPPFTVHFNKDNIVHMNDRPYYGISLCLSGQLTYTQDGHQIISDPGCAVFLPLGGNYHIHGDREGDFPLINFMCEGLECHQIFALPLSNPQSCIQDYEEIRHLFLFGGSRARIFSLFYQLIDKVFAHMQQDKNPLIPAIRYIEARLADPCLSNKLLAAQVGISEVYLRKLFQKHYHITPKQYILELRLHLAKQLLTDGSMNVTQIAEKCGFSSVYHFCTAFKGRTGITPTEYGKRNRAPII